MTPLGAGSLSTKIRAATSEPDRGGARQLGRLTWAATSIITIKFGFIGARSLQLQTVASTPGDEQKETLQNERDEDCGTKFDSLGLERKLVFIS